MQLREADEIIDVLNDQTRLLFEWKTQIYKLLTESLTSSEGEGADGEEYSRSLDTQGQAEALMQVEYFSRLSAFSPLTFLLGLLRARGRP